MGGQGVVVGPGLGWGRLANGGYIVGILSGRHFNQSARYPLTLKFNLCAICLEALIKALEFVIDEFGRTKTKIEDILDLFMKCCKMGTLSCL